MESGAGKPAAVDRLYEPLMLTLCVLALGAMGIETFILLDEDTLQLLQWADTFLCAIFLGDFLVSLYRAQKRVHYLITWGWIDLASSIPMVDVLRWGRLARAFRVLRILRGVRVTKILATFLLDRRAEGTFVTAALISLLLIVFSSIAILQVETTSDANIRNPGDAVWWAFVTLTTVGYGDRFPVTAEGRLVAALLMTAGVGLFGVLSGFVASWFLTPSRKKQDRELEDIRLEILELRRTIERK